MGNHPNRGKRADIYAEGVMWIAQNDEPAIMEAAEMTGLISVLMLADLVKVTPDTIAKAVIRTRQRLAALEREPAA